MSTRRPTSSRAARDRAREAREQAAQRRRERRTLIVVAAALVLVLVGGGILLQAWRTSRSPSAAAVAPSAAVTPIAISNGRPLVFGSADAPVTIRLYEDFHCPHCADFEETYASTLDAAVAAGTVSIHFYPMAFIDQGSAAAANAMACASEAGFGPAYSTGLFANHTLQWSTAQLISLADQITGGATPAGFTACVQQGSHLPWVQSINAAADQAGVQQTPTMFIDDRPVDITTLTVDSLKQKIADAAA
ncbi:MAG TPA: thioredoxin domain-containing protein [Microlunatus sp.]|nr:thioredoxin domain-containing protein [Microlunatus sp.]